MGDWEEQMLENLEEGPVTFLKVVEFILAQVYDNPKIVSGVAAVTKQFFDEFIKVGFSSGEALELTKALMGVPLHTRSR